MHPLATKLRFVALVLAVPAALGLAGAIWSIPSTLRLARGGRAEGTVVAFERIGRSRHLVVRAVREGGPLQFTSKVSRPSGVKVGDLVPVRYDPDDPSLVDVDSFDTIWGRVVIPGAIGLVFGAMAVLVLWLRRALVEGRFTFETASGG